jgi:hypothetical protein
MCGSSPNNLLFDALRMSSLSPESAYGTTDDLVYHPAPISLSSSIIALLLLIVASGV